MKGYTVFNCEQIDNLPEHYYALAQAPTETITRIDRAEVFFANAKIDVKHGGNMAYYGTKTGPYSDAALRDFPRRREPTTRRWRTNRRTGRDTRSV